MADEQVFVNVSPHSKDRGVWDILLSNRKLLAVVGVIIVIELIWAWNALFNPGLGSTSSSGHTALDAMKVPEASLKVVGAQVVKVGENLPVDIVLQTQKVTEGVDVVLKYDPEVLEPVASGSAVAKVGTIFADYPVNTVDLPGIVQISAVTRPGQEGFVGQGLLANLTFKALKVGQTTIRFDFTPNSDSDTNIVEEQSGRDILEMVDNLEVKIEQ